MGRNNHEKTRKTYIRNPKQGGGLIASFISNFPALRDFQRTAQDDSSFLFKRGKGSRLYDMDGNRFFDFSLDSGRLLYGHAPAFLTHSVKNANSLGRLDNQLTMELSRFLSVFRHRFPELVAYELFFLSERRAPAALLRSAFAGWDPLVPERFVERDDFSRLESRVASLAGGGSPLLLDQTGIAFFSDPELLIGRLRPEAAAVSFCGIHLLLLRPGHALSPVSFLPSVPVLAEATAFLKNLTGPREPFSLIREHSRTFESLCSAHISGWAGFSPKIEMKDEHRQSLLHRGFLLPASGYVHFCAAHDLHEVKRLAASINDLFK